MSTYAVDATFISTAERHARLLAQIEQYVNDAGDKAYSLEDDPFLRGDRGARAHIKALLEQPEESTRVSSPPPLSLS